MVASLNKGTGIVDLYAKKSLLFKRGGPGWTDDQENMDIKIITFGKNVRYDKFPFEIAIDIYIFQFICRIIRLEHTALSLLRLNRGT
jgi:hypothetical protein